MVGNACEVRESLDILSGGGPEDVRELVIALGGAMVELAHGVAPPEASKRIATVLDNGDAMDRFQRMVHAQGGDLAALPEHTGETPVLADSNGFVGGIDGLEVGLCGVALGAGRTRADQAVDPLVGVRIDKHRGTAVQRGEPLATVLHGASGPPDPAIVDRLACAFQVCPEEPESAPLILERID